MIEAPATSSAATRIVDQEERSRGIGREVALSVCGLRRRDHGASRKVYSRILIAFLACRLMTSALFQRDRPAIGADSRQIYAYNTAKIRCSTDESGNQANFF